MITQGNVPILASVRCSSERCGDILNVEDATHIDSPAIDIPRTLGCSSVVLHPRSSPPSSPSSPHAASLMVLPAHIFTSTCDRMGSPAFRVLVPTSSLFVLPAATVFSTLGFPHTGSCRSHDALADVEHHTQRSCGAPEDSANVVSGSGDENGSFIEEEEEPEVD